MKDGRTHLAHKAEAVDLDTGAIVGVTVHPIKDATSGLRSPAACAQTTTARDAVYIRGARGQRLLRQRGERLERPFAHLYETGALRRVHLRGHTNILKRVLVHTGGFNLGLLMRRLIGVGTPRGLQGRLTAVFDTLCTLWRLWTVPVRLSDPPPSPLTDEAPAFRG